MSQEVEFEGGYLMPLLDSHPGVAVIGPQHVEYVRRKVEAYKVLHPDHIAQYPPPKPDAKPISPGTDFYRQSDYVDDPRYDGNLCRAEWLIYWMSWAVENCDKPIFYNS